MPEEERDNDIKSEIKSEIAQQKPRDEEGHFIHAEPPPNPEQPQPPQNPVSKFFAENTHYSKGQDDLLDVHVGNPLKRITELLEDIKKQKAFNFTLKGSLGIMGVFLTLSVFGIFGGGQILCDKGTQVEIGTVKQLQVLQEDPGSSIPVLSQLLDYFNPKQSHPKFILIKNDETVIQLPFSRNVDLVKFANYRVVATGNYNACGGTLTITDPNAVEMYLSNQR